MWLEDITLLNFKNYQALSLEFSDHINCFVGDNGSGKTNLLDAIYFLSMAKSAFAAVDQQNIMHHQDFFMAKGTFSRLSKKHVVQGHVKAGQKKVLKANDKAYTKISNHIGAFPVVLIAPNDTDIIREGSEMRRKFIDSIICQVDKVYIQDLIRYNHILKQRNSLLKQFHEQNRVDTDLLEPYNHQLVELANRIYAVRVAFMVEYIPLVADHYTFLSQSREKADISYMSDLQDNNFKNLLSDSLSKDLALQRTTKGIHKDDFVLKLDGHILKKFGSQGQQKSYLVALKFAQFDMIKKHKNFKPILLLDDIFDKLDDLRISKMIELIAGDTFQQLFVTDARPERTARLFEAAKLDIRFFNIRSGVVSLQ